MPREYCVAALLLLLLRVLISLVSVLNVLYFYISTFRSMCVQCQIFCSSLTSCFPGMLLTYFLNDFAVVPAAPIITGITFVFTFHMRCISIVRSLYFRIFSASFLITSLSPEIATSINRHVPFLLSRIIMSGLLLGIVLLVCTGWFYYYYYYYCTVRYIISALRSFTSTLIDDILFVPPTTEFLLFGPDSGVIRTTPPPYRPDDRRTVVGFL